MSDLYDSAALDAAAGPGATAILSGMLSTLSEVLGRLDERLGRLEARAVAPPVEVDVEQIAEAVLERLRRDADPAGEVVARTAAATEQLGYVVDGVRAELARLRGGEAVGPAVEALRHAVEDLAGRVASVAERRTDDEVAALRRTLDETMMALGDRNEAHAASVREMVSQVADELRRLAATDDDDDVGGRDVTAVVAGAVQGTERALARLHADLRGAIEELALAMAERQDGQAAALTRVEAELRTTLAAQSGAVHDIQAALGDRLEAELRMQVAPLRDLQADLVERVEAAVGAQAAIVHELRAALDARLHGQGEVLERLRAEASAQAFAVEQLRTEAAERGPVPVEGLDRVEALLAALHAELDERSAGQVALVDRLLADQTVALGRVEADVQAAIAALRSDLADQPDPADLAGRHADALRRALEDAVTALAERQMDATASLHQAVERLRGELVALGEPDGDDDADGESGAGAAQAVAELLGRHAAAARDDLARIETVLRGQVAEVSGRAGSITDVIGRLDGRLHEVVDGVRALSRHLEATASLVPAVEALRAEVDELRRLSEQPRLRAVNGGSSD